MRTVLLLLVVSSVAQADVIITKDRVGHFGTIIEDNERGYVFQTDKDETILIKFDQIDEIQRTPRLTVNAAALEPSKITLLNSQLLTLREERAGFTIAMPIVLTSLGGVLGVTALSLYANGNPDLAALTGVAAAAFFLPSFIILCVKLAIRGSYANRINAVVWDIVQAGGMPVQET